MTKKKVFVVLLNQGTESTALSLQLYKWMVSMPEYSFEFHPSKYTNRPISNNRNQIVKDFLKTDNDFLFMIDDDNPPIKNPFELIKYDKDVIGAIVPGWGSNGIRFHIYKFGKNFPKRCTFEQYDNHEIKGLTKIDAIGTCCIIIKRKVLKKIKRPFEDTFDKDGILINNDDLSFSLKCYKNGFEIWTHGDYMCSHYKKIDLLQMAHLLIKAKNAR